MPSLYMPRLYMPKPTLLWLTVVCVLSACASNPYDPDVVEAGSQAPIERDTSTGEEAESATPAQQRPNTATRTLLASAQEASASGQHGDAITYLERAVRMQPRDPALWTELARAYLANDEHTNATRHVRKAIALASGNEAQTRAAWLTMADIEEAQGNVAEARSIRRRWRTGRG